MESFYHVLTDLSMSHTIMGEQKEAPAGTGAEVIVKQPKNTTKENILSPRLREDEAREALEPSKVESDAANSRTRVLRLKELNAKEEPWDLDETRETELRPEPPRRFSKHESLNAFLRDFHGKNLKPLTPREKKIWDVIRANPKSKGLSYCYALDRARIQPRRTGIWKDAHRNYEETYKMGKPWPHRIEDEKSDIKRRAEGLGL